MLKEGNFQHLNPEDVKRKIQEALEELFQEGEVFELCVINPKRKQSRNWQGSASFPKGIVAGWFNDPSLAAHIAANVDYDDQPEGIYVTLNPCDPALLGRAKNRLIAGVSRTKDQEITCLRHVLIDLDPRRPSGVSSTREELEAATILLETTLPWPGLKAVSGNGAHLILRLPDLKNTAENVAVIKAFLKAANAHYGNDRIAIDEQTFNPSRLARLYWTTARKGENIEERPHRRSFIIHKPDQWEPMMIEALAEWTQANAPQAEPAGALPVPSPTPGNGQRLDVPKYLAAHGVEVIGTKRHEASTLYLLSHCVFDPSHGPKEAAIGQHDNGRIFYKCFHDSCRNRTWEEAIAVISGDKPLNDFMLRGREARKESSRIAFVETSGDENEDDTPSRLPPFPIEAFHDKYRELIKETARAYSVPVEMVVAPFLAAVAATIGRSRMIYAGGEWTEPCVLWLALVADSGEGKTPVTQFLHAPLSKIESKLDEEFKALWKQYEASLAEWKKANSQKNAPPPGPRPDPPLRQQIIIDDATLESLTEALLGSPRGILWCRDELAGLILDMDRYVSTKGGTKARLLTAYSGGPWKVSRVNKSRICFVEHAAINLFGTVQPAVLSRVFNKDDILNGFLPRLQMIFAKSETPRFLSYHCVSEELKSLWNSTLNHLFGLPFSTTGHPLVVKIAPDALNDFGAWYNHIAARPWTEPDASFLKPFLSKLQGRCLRVALLLHELDCFLRGVDDIEEPVTQETMHRAILIANAFVAHQERAMAYIQPNGNSRWLNLSPLQKRILESVLALEDAIEGQVIPTQAIADMMNQNAPAALHVNAISVGKAAQSLELRAVRARYKGETRRCLFIPADFIAKIKKHFSKSPSETCHIRHTLNFVSNYEASQCDGCENQPVTSVTGDVADVEVVTDVTDKILSVTTATPCHTKESDGYDGLPGRVSKSHTRPKLRRLPLLPPKSDGGKDGGHSRRGSKSP